MARVDEIRAEQKRLEEELAKVLKEERDVVLADIKEKIKLFGFKSSDFRGVLARRKRKKPSTVAAK